MARHKNVRNFVDDDFDTYDELMPSSYDDDSLSPSERFAFFNRSQRNVSVAIRVQQQLNFNEQDFELENFEPKTAETTTERPNGTVQTKIDTEKDVQDLLFDDGDFSKPAPIVQTPAKTNPNSSKSVLDRPEHSSTPLRTASPSPSIQASPAKPYVPIDRSLLKKIYSDSLEEFKGKSVLNLIVVGHVDAGKSTLMGNLLCQLGLVSDKQLNKFQWEAQKIGKGSFAFAWVLDQTSEERERGVTMDVAQTTFETATKRIVLLDAPGHKDFVPQVISGACQADCAVLVINATRGEFETGFEDNGGGQTKEHARIIRLLGVTRVIVAVNKLDTEDWSEARFTEIQNKLMAFFKALNMSSVEFCPLSGLYGVNLTPESASWCKKRHSQSSESDIRKAAPWYKGSSLLEMIDKIPTPEREVDGPFRFVVSDLFKPTGSSLYAVVGRVISGGVTAGVNLPTSKVLCQPSAHNAIVKSIKSLSLIESSTEGCLDDSSAGANLLNYGVKASFAGDQVALILQGIDPTISLAPGDVIVDPDNPLPMTSRIKAKVLVFSIDKPITRGYSCIMYYQCRSLTCTISKLFSCSQRKNKTDLTTEKPRLLTGNCTADVEMKLEKPICMDLYDKCKPLGRFTLRNDGKSIAGGTVTSIYPMLDKVGSLASLAMETS